MIAIYSHEGYVPAKSSNYDGERAAQKVAEINTKVNTQDKAALITASSVKVLEQ